MNELTIDKKKYVILKRKDYEQLQKRAAIKTKPDGLFSIAEARAFSKQLIQKWSKEK